MTTLAAADAGRLPLQRYKHAHRTMRTVAPYDCAGGCIACRAASMTIRPRRNRVSQTITPAALVYVQEISDYTPDVPWSALTGGCV